MKNAETKTETKEIQKSEIKLEMAPKPIPFLEGEYFRGLCEIAAAALTNQPLFVPEKTLGIFQSLYFKRIYGRIENKDGSYTVGNFLVENEFLYNKETGEAKEENITTFKEIIKEIKEVGAKAYKVFSLTPIEKKEISLDELIAE